MLASLNDETFRSTLETNHWTDDIDPEDEEAAAVVRFEHETRAIDEQDVQHESFRPLQSRSHALASSQPVSSFDRLTRLAKIYKHQLILEHFFYVGQFTDKDLKR